MPALPPKDNRVLLAFEALKFEIKSGQLTSPLPGERELAMRLNISRKTVRKAMAMLEEQLWVSPAEHGRRRQILKTATTHAPKASTNSLLGKTVIIMAPRALGQMSGIEKLFQSRLTRLCEKVGITLKHRHLDVRHMKQPAHRLSEFVLQNPADAYLLQHSTQSIQKWFELEKIPALILGDCWGGVRLPSVAGDHEATAVHAAGLLQRNGHKTVALLLPEPSKRGLEVFTKKLKATAPDIHFTIIKHEETPESTTAAVHKLFSQQSSIPTAVIAGLSFATVSLVSFAGRHGFRIPEDISLISLAYDEVLNYLQPTTAVYNNNWESYTRVVSQSVSELLLHPLSLNVEPALIMPDFVKGDSLAKAP